MFKYFKELLRTLQSIEHCLKRISLCVHPSSRSYGDRYSISTKKWND